MELGRLEEESTASLCRRLASESRTGCLHVTGEVGEGTLQADLYLRDGRIYTATAPGGRARLADRLIGGGDLTPEQLEVALVLKDQQPPKTRLGDVLVASGMVDRMRLRTVIREQIVDSVAVPLAWTHGSWRFEDGEEVMQDIPLGLGMQDTLMEAARRLGQIEVIQAHMGPMDTVVDFARTGDEAKLSLKPDEWAMLTHIDGQRSVADIAEQAGYTQLETARIIYGLLSAGVVVRAQDTEAAEAAEAAQRAASEPQPGALPTRRRSPAGPPTATAPPPAVPTAQPTTGEGYLEQLEGYGQLGTSPWAPAAPPSGAAAPPAPPPGAASTGQHHPDSGADRRGGPPREDPAGTMPHGLPAVPPDTPAPTPDHPPRAPRPERKRRFRRGG